VSDKKMMIKKYPIYIYIYTHIKITTKKNKNTNNTKKIKAGCDV